MHTRISACFYRLLDGLCLDLLYDVVYTSVLQKFDDVDITGDCSMIAQDRYIKY